MSFYIDKHLGRRLMFSNGLGIGFAWVHGSGHTTKTSAILASYHPPRSLTWLWAVYWGKPTRATGFKYGRSRHSAHVSLPLIGSFSLCWQEACPR